MRVGPELRRARVLAIAEMVIARLRTPATQLTPICTTRTAAAPRVFHPRHPVQVD